MVFTFEPESLFFYPDNLNHGGHPNKKNFRFKSIKIPSTDQIELDGWFVLSQSEAPKATVVHFHGNACNITNHWGFVDWLPSLGFDVLTFDYRGYGKSPGKPTFDGVFNDCCAVIDFVRTYPIIRSHNLIILGQSLGAAFAICAVAKKMNRDILGFIADSTFYSFREIAALKAPLIPRQFARGISANLFTNQFEPADFIQKLKMPKLFIHSTHDPVIPYELGLELYHLAPEPKTFIKLTSPEHLALFSVRHGDQWESVLHFLNAICIEGKTVAVEEQVDVETQANNSNAADG